jgi:hypothetical protein
MLVQAGDSVMVGGLVMKHIIVNTMSCYSDCKIHLYVQYVPMVSLILRSMQLALTVLFRNGQNLHSRCFLHHSSTVDNRLHGY